jgi:hypothetical protein
MLGLSRAVCHDLFLGVALARLAASRVALPAHPGSTTDSHTIDAEHVEVAVLSRFVSVDTGARGPLFW